MTRHLSLQRILHPHRHHCAACGWYDCFCPLAYRVYLVHAWHPAPVHQPSTPTPPQGDPAIRRMLQTMPSPQTPLICTVCRQRAGDTWVLCDAIDEPTGQVCNALLCEACATVVGTDVHQCPEHVRGDRS